MKTIKIISALVYLFSLISIIGRSFHFELQSTYHIEHELAQRPSQVVLFLRDYYIEIAYAGLFLVVIAIIMDRRGYVKSRFCFYSAVVSIIAVISTILR
jgi:hypothetical protein